MTSGPDARRSCHSIAHGLAWVAACALITSAPVTVAQSITGGEPLAICAEAGQVLAFNLRPAGDSVIAIVDAEEGQWMATFSELPASAGSAQRWSSPERDHRACYLVGSFSAVSSQVYPVRALTSRQNGFDDSADGIYVDSVASHDALAERPGRFLVGAIAGAMAGGVLARTYGETGGVSYAHDDPSPSPGTMPQFDPWPPPDASARHVIGAALVTRNGNARNWGDVADRFDTALGAAGYSNLSYYAVPGGFAIATSVERIDSQGEPEAGASRWQGSAADETWTLQALLRRLVGAPLGHYRAIVFVFAADAFGTSGAAISAEDASRWRTGGLNRLPGGLRGRPYSDDFRCDVLVYVFEQRAELPQTRQVAGGLSVDEHLRRARILAQLEPQP